MIVDIGNFSLILSCVLCTYIASCLFLGRALSINVLIASGKSALYAVPFLVAIATFALVYAFVNNDFSVQYVAENSNLEMPRAYTWVAFYAGNAGSLLFICLVFSILAIIVSNHVFKRAPIIASYSMGTMIIILTFFLAVTAFLAEPFQRLANVPVNGEGINPLLVHFGMFVHPPMQMGGLIAVCIPFSLGIGAMLSGKHGIDTWIDVGRFWGMLSWSVLTIGLILGSWWAYTILGWGGYWAWDPVENSALMPWLVLTAFIHSIIVQKRRGMFRMWNIILVILAFTLAELGMFINRGGPVPSVHSFAQSTMGWVFLSFMVFTMIISLLIFVFRVKIFNSDRNLESAICRESAFLAQNVLFVIVAMVTLWGTLYPVFADVASDTDLTVGKPFFDLVNGPLLLLIVMLMSVGPVLPWRKTTVSQAFRLLIYPFVSSLILIVFLIALGITQLPAIVGIWTCFMAVFTISQEWVKGSIARHKRGENYAIANIKILNSNRTRYGGYIVHLGIAMLAIGAIGSSFYDVQQDFVLVPGESAKIGNYEFNYLNIKESNFGDRIEQSAEFQVHKKQNNLGGMVATRTYYPSHNIAATRAAIRSNPIEDFYIVPSEFDDDGKAVFRVYVNPLVWWMWAAGPVMILGALIAVSHKINYQQTVGTRGG